MHRILCAAFALNFALFANTTLALGVSPVELDLSGHTAQPNVSPTNDGFVLSWQQKQDKGCSALFTATLSASGKLGEAREVTSGCDWFVNWIDFPSVAVAKNGDWLTYWLQKSNADNYAYDIHVTRSSDQGVTWSASAIPHQKGTAAEHGFVAMAPLTADRVLMIWLDGSRAAAMVALDHDHNHSESEAPMALQSAEIDRASALHYQQEIDARVCSCCSTDLITSGSGAKALFRDRSKDEIRDISSASYQNGRWSNSANVNADGWKISGCPTNGPALAQVGQRHLAVWPTMINDQLEVRAKYLGSGAAPFRIERGPQVLGRPDVATIQGKILVSWLGQGKKPDQSALKLKLLNANLNTLGELALVQLPGGRNIGVPKLAVFRDQAVLVWTESSAPGQSQIRAVRVRL